MIQGKLKQLLGEKAVGDQLFQIDYIQPCKDIYKFDAKLRNLSTNADTTLDLK